MQGCSQDPRWEAMPAYPNEHLETGCVHCRQHSPEWRVGYNCRDPQASHKSKQQPAVSAWSLRRLHGGACFWLKASKPKHLHDKTGWARTHRGAACLTILAIPGKITIRKPLQKLQGNFMGRPIMPFHKRVGPFGTRKTVTKMTITNVQTIGGKWLSRWPNHRHL